jgi:hypothetical protein
MSIVDHASHFEVDHASHFEYVSGQIVPAGAPNSFTLKGEDEIGAIRSAAYPLQLWLRSLQAQATNHRAAANIAMQTKANSAVPRSAVRRSPRRLSVSLIMVSLSPPMIPSIIRRVDLFLRHRFRTLSSKPHAARARPDVNDGILLTLRTRVASSVCLNQIRNLYSSCSLMRQSTRRPAESWEQTP